MKKVKIDIPLELYTDNVRKIIEQRLHDPDTKPPYIASFRKGKNRNNKTEVY